MGLATQYYTEALHDKTTAVQERDQEVQQVLTSLFFF